MGKALDLTGQRFGRLVVLWPAADEARPLDRAGFRKRAWVVVCDCGTPPRVVTTQALRHARTRSCGCARRCFKPVAKTCPVCGEPFEGFFRRKYCSDACVLRDHVLRGAERQKRRRRRAAPAGHNCLCCGAWFVHAFPHPRRKFCGDRCARLAANRRYNAWLAELQAAAGLARIAEAM